MNDLETQLHDALHALPVTADSGHAMSGPALRRTARRRTGRARTGGLAVVVAVLVRDDEVSDIVIFEISDDNISTFLGDTQGACASDTACATCHNSNTTFFGCGKT